MTERKMCVLTYSTNLSEKFSTEEEFSEISYIYIGLNVKYPLFLSDLMKQIFELY